MTPVLFVGFCICCPCAATTAPESRSAAAGYERTRMRPSPSVCSCRRRIPRRVPLVSTFRGTTSEIEPDVEDDAAWVQHSRRLPEERRRKDAAVARVVAAIRQVLCLQRERQPVTDCVGERADARHVTAGELGR